MKLILLTIIIATTLAEDDKCGACFYGRCYVDTNILKDVDVNSQVAIDRTNNILYFHFYDRKNEHHNAVLDLDYLDFQEQHIGFTFAHAVDQVARDVYIAISKGLLKFNRISLELKSLNLDQSFYKLQFEEKLYCLKLTNGLYVYKNGTFDPIKEDLLTKYLIDDFVVDKKDDIYFLSNEKVYLLKNGTEEVKEFADRAYILTTDRYGDVYFIQPDFRTLDKLDYRNGTLMNVGHFSTGIVPFNILFTSNDDIVYYDPYGKNLNLLTGTSETCEQGSAKRGKVGVF